MAMMEWSRADKIVDAVSDKIRAATGLDVVPDEGGTNGSFASGPYSDMNDHFVFGSKPLVRGKASGFVSCTDVASMCKQQLHEYRHWQQRQLFRSLPYGPGDSGLPVMPFADDAQCRLMARQRLIAAEFQAYQKANQFILSYERDAEEYALSAAPDVLAEAGFPKGSIEPCLVEEVNRRIGWYGDWPVGSVKSAIEDLHAKKHIREETELPLDYVPRMPRDVSATFLGDTKALEKYGRLDPKDIDGFLFDYIARRDPKIFGMYGIISDEMPKLSAFERMQRDMYRLSHDVPDENVYDGPDI